MYTQLIKELLLGQAGGSPVTGIHCCIRRTSSSSMVVLHDRNMFVFGSKSPGAALSSTPQAMEKNQPSCNPSNHPMHHPTKFK